MFASRIFQKNKRDSVFLLSSCLLLTYFHITAFISSHVVLSLMKTDLKKNVNNVKKKINNIYVKNNMIIKKNYD